MFKNVDMSCNTNYKDDIPSQYSKSNIANADSSKSNSTNKTPAKRAVLSDNIYVSRQTVIGAMGILLTIVVFVVVFVIVFIAFSKKKKKHDYVSGGARWKSVTFATSCKGLFKGI